MPAQTESSEPSTTNANAGAPKLARYQLWHRITAIASAQDEVKKIVRQQWDTPAEKAMTSPEYLKARAQVDVMFHALANELGLAPGDRE